MRRIWNTLLYGDRRTKAYLWSIVLLIVGAIASCVAFVVTLNIWWIFGILGGLIAAAVVGSSVKFREIDSAENGGTVLAGAPLRESASDEKHSDKKVVADRQAEEDSAVSGAEGNEKEGTENRRKFGDAEPEKTEDETPEENEKFLKSLHKKQVKKLFFKYKVKRVHYPILIEECKSRRLRECPAYAWVNKGCLQILALSSKTRAFAIPLSKMHTILGERAARANPKEEYVMVKEAKYIAKVFQPLIPSYYIMADENGRRTYRKNRYILAKDLVVTDRSARALMELTQAGFVLPEDAKMEKAYGTYATEAYKLKFLCQEGVVLPEEYKVKIRILLQQMVEAGISDYEFSKNLSLMVKKQLITEEYAKYYEDARLGRL